MNPETQNEVLPGSDETGTRILGYYQQLENIYQLRREVKVFAGLDRALSEITERGGITLDNLDKVSEDTYTQIGKYAVQVLLNANAGNASMRELNAQDNQVHDELVKMLTELKTSKQQLRVVSLFPKSPQILAARKRGPRERIFSAVGLASPHYRVGDVTIGNSLDKLVLDRRHFQRDKANGDYIVEIFTPDRQIAVGITLDI